MASGGQTMTLESGVTMATADECRIALDQLTARISEMDAKGRADHLRDRTLSCHVSDLGVTFLTRLGPHGADPVKQVTDGRASAQVRFTAKSDDVLRIASDPGSFARAWLAGRLKVEGNFFDLLHLRKLM
jgi:predicted lipid carrier protein YhbT